MLGSTVRYESLVVNVGLNEPLLLSYPTFRMKPNLVLALKLQPRSDRLRQSGFKDFIKVKVSGEITVLYVPYNGEAAGFAVELYKELSQAGWKMTGFGPKPADLEPIWSSERLMVSESFASIAIVSHDDADASRLRWQSVPLDKTYGENGTNDIVLVEVKPPILDFSKPPPKDLLKEFRPTGRKDRYSLQLPPAGALAEALKKAGFHNEQQINPNLPPKKVIVVIGAKE